MAGRKNSTSNGANVGYEAELWKMADALRGSMDAAEYKHVVLGLIFLKYISDAFGELHAKLQGERKEGADPEDPDEYRAKGIFWVPPEARWSHLKAQAKQPTIGQLVDDAMAGIERDNQSLKGVLPKEYARPALDKTRLGQIIDLISNIDFRSGQPSPGPSGHPLPRVEGKGDHYRGGYDFAGLVERARELRRTQTPAEQILWETLRDRRFMGLKFRRQHQFGDYIADFYCDEHRLVVELDGEVHAARQRKDKKRDAWIQGQGLKVLRFSNKQVLDDPESVLRGIANAIPPSPSGRGAGGEGGQEETIRSYDMLGRVYEYFLSMFASAEGKKGGEFYTPRCVVKLLVEMLEPYKGRVYDPCCGSSGMFVQSEEFIVAHGGRFGDISIYGQESNYTTWRLAKMNLAIRGIEGRIEHGDSFHNDRHPDLKADYILANPPFNVSDWGGERVREDKRWRYGIPPAGNANFAWVQHIVHHLAPMGLAGFVLANGSMSSNQSGEGEIRRNLIEADLVDCMVALPGQLFYSTQIPACLWFLARDRKNGKFRDRRGHVLFIDARKLGAMVDRTHRELRDERYGENEIARIARAYHAWRGEKGAGKYADVPGFCKSATLEDVRKHGHVLTPGRYVGAEAQEDDGEPFEEKMKRLTATLCEQQADAAKLDEAILKNLKELGYGV